MFFERFLSFNHFVYRLFFTVTDFKRSLVIQGLFQDFLLLFEVSCKIAQKSIRLFFFHHKSVETLTLFLPSLSSADQFLF